MAGHLFLLGICGAGVSFLSWFLLALWRDRPIRRVVYLLGAQWEFEPSGRTEIWSARYEIDESACQSAYLPTMKKISVESFKEVSPEQFAEIFYRYHEALAPDFGFAQNRLPAWRDVPQNERERLVAATRLALFEIGSAKQERDEDSRRWFAKPGEAEWGC